MQQHPVEGAKLLLAKDGLDLAAAVAYEHHVMIDGGGYPKLRHGRGCHLGSRLVHICDVFDALRTKRPYREAWEQERVLAYLESKAGTELDAELVGYFVAMMRQNAVQRLSLEDVARTG